jgi:hypothetical protein
MARNTTGMTPTTSRRKKAASSVPPVPVQDATELRDVPAQPVPNQASSQVREEVRKAAPKNGAPAAQMTAVNLTAVNLEEEIRRRAYELYVQRRASGFGENGNENQDWLVAEHEIRSRYGAKQMGAAAGSRA